VAFVVTVVTALTILKVVVALYEPLPNINASLTPSTLTNVSPCNNPEVPVPVITKLSVLGLTVKEVPDDPLVPEDPEVPLVPEDPEDPDVPEDPELPLVPEDPELPLVPEDPEDPLVPEDPEDPLVPEDPEDPDVPLVPFNPLNTHDIVQGEVIVPLPAK